MESTSVGVAQAEGRPRPRIPSEQREQNARRAGRPSVLIVDDVDDNLLALEGMLRRDDAAILTARSGRQALEILLERDVALAIIDVQMPEMDGFELAELMRGVDRTRHVPIIFITAGMADQSRVFRGYEAGAVDFLFKPIDDRVLRGKVDVLVTLHKQRQELDLALDLADSARRDAEHVRDRIERLQRVTESLNQVLTREAIGTVCLPLICDAVGAAAGSLRLLTADGAELEVVHSIGLPPELVVASQRVPVTANAPVAEAVRSGQPIFVESRDAYEGKYPAGEAIYPLEMGARAALPLVTGPRGPIGTMTLVFLSWRALSTDDRAFLVAVADQCAQALDRAIAYDELRRSEGLRETVIADLRRSVALNEIFTGILGHDLGNPLAAITMSARIALNHSDKEVAVNALSRILRSGKRMAGLIDQLLDFTRVRLGNGIPIDAKPIDLMSVVLQVAEELEGTYPGGVCRFEQEGDSQGIWDPDRLAQVFSNLLANAFKHGIASDGVRVRIDGRGEDVIGVEVHNMGAIPPEVMPTIFEPFVRGDGSRQNAKGLGLGLFITREIVKAHGGSIEVHSDEASGTVFTVLLPRTVGE